MTPTINTHLELLVEQLSCVFRYINDRRVHRSKFKEFHPLIVDGISTLQYHHEELTAGRSIASVMVFTEHRTFHLIQHYNYGVLLNVEIRVSDEDINNPLYTMAELINRYSSDLATVKDAMVDFEYALSLVTEHVSKQLNQLGI